MFRKPIRLKNKNLSTFSAKDENKGPKKDFQKDKFLFRQQGLHTLNRFENFLYSQTMISKYRNFIPSEPIQLSLILVLNCSCLGHGAIWKKCITIITAPLIAGWELGTYMRTLQVPVVTRNLFPDVNKVITRVPKRQLTGYNSLFA